LVEKKEDTLRIFEGGGGERLPKFRTRGGREGKSSQARPIKKGMGGRRAAQRPRRSVNKEAGAGPPQRKKRGPEAMGPRPITFQGVGSKKTPRKDNRRKTESD